MPRKPNLDKFHAVLFDNIDDITLNESERQQLMRYRTVFTLSMEKPHLPDVELRNHLMDNFGISAVQAYHDIHQMRILLGNVRNAGKEWVRYLVNESLKKAIDDAQRLGNKGIKLVIAATNVLGKFNMLDKEDGIDLNWDEIKPVPIEPTNDPTVLNVKPLENKEEVIRKLYEKYKGDIEIEDIDYESV
jgi:hypothetical protein